MATDPTDRSCVHCSSRRLELDPDLLMYWCLECGQGTTTQQAMQGPAMDDECPECGDVMILDQDDGMRHSRDDLVAPKCPIHREELAVRRRSQMRLVQGGA